MITLADFQKLELRVGTVVEAVLHPNAERLLVVTVDLGAERRQVVAGIRSAYQPEQLIGRSIVLLANLEPAVIRGVESQGMLLAASDAQGIVVLTTDRPAAPGSPIK